MAKRGRRKMMHHSHHSYSNPKSAEEQKPQLKKRCLNSRVVTKARNKNAAAFNLDLLVDGWLELESDPGTFSLLIEDFGCFGAQVDEIYDLEQKFNGPVFGFIFLFKWLNDQHAGEHRANTRNQKSVINSGKSGQPQQQSYQCHSKNVNSSDQHHWSYVQDEDTLNQIFFAKQMISNSCATHALISILLNCDCAELKLGSTLSKLKEHTRVMDPENKGHAIGNVPELAKAHNSHASYSSLYSRNKPSSSARGTSFAIRGNQRTNLQLHQYQQETYHFVSYVPIKGRLYELDGLKSYPIDHGPLNPNEDWTEKFRKVIKQRLLDNTTGDNSTSANDIRYNLMAVVQDRRLNLKTQLTKLKCHLRSVQDSVAQLSKRQFLYPTMVGEAQEHQNRTQSPVSNGTLTASETGSLCESPKYIADDNMLTADSDIPNPPYSPLSNGTATASEVGSVCNSPAHLEDSYFCTDEARIEKYFFVRFGPESESDTSTPVTTTTTSTAAQCQPMQEKSQALDDLRKLVKRLEYEMLKTEFAIKEENDKRRKHKIDNSRRTHNYEPFIMTFLSLLARQGNLAELIERDLGLAGKGAQASPIQPMSAPRDQIKPKPKYKYVSTGRPRGRPRKHPLPTEQIPPPT